VHRIRFSPDGILITGASDDGLAILWDAASGQQLYALSGHSDGVTDVEFSPDGKRLYTASVDGTSRVHLLDLDELIALAQERVTRSLTDEECFHYLHVDTCPPD
jgi:WD40 repeat protein